MHPGSANSTQLDLESECARGLAARRRSYLGEHGIDACTMG